MFVESAEDAAAATALRVQANTTNTNTNTAMSLLAQNGTENTGASISSGQIGNTQVLNSIGNVGIQAIVGDNSGGASLPSVGIVSISTRSSDEDNIGIWTSSLNGGTGDAIGLRIGYYNTTIASDFSTNANGDLTIKPSGGTGAIIVTGAIGNEWSTLDSPGSNINDVDTRGISSYRISVPGGGTTCSGFANGFNGKEIVVVNTGEGVLRFTHQDVASFTNNRLILGNAAASINLRADDSATFKYDNTTRRWRLISAFI